MIRMMIPALKNEDSRKPAEGSINPIVTLYACFLCVIILFLSAGASAANDPWGPWSVSEDAPNIPTKSDRKAATLEPLERPDRTISATPFLWMLTFYQKTIGPVVSGRCPMYPTCSQYSVEAIHKHGPVVGIVMTADRMMHELDEQNHAPLIKVGGRYRYSDPVRNNDFWWYTE
jgi:hypothetical protein